jgi:dTDP-4-amino-4,6-dideoxygalactose transaminase
LANIKVNLHYIPVYLQPFYKNKGFKRGYCKNAESYFQEIISLPMYTGFSEEQQEIVCDHIHMVFEKLAAAA